jgi:hypothetical protein
MIKTVKSLYQAGTFWRGTLLVEWFLSSSSTCLNSNKFEVFLNYIFYYKNFFKNPIGFISYCVSNAYYSNAYTTHQSVFIKLCAFI